ncbi:hypothetical protein HMPREF9193_01427 [Treponema lecithinolyticum ATCC 700332]|uniref:Uncharacterized protein n=1 Tax=Treponema lecithinolyticum ATCC 700332 TaxID=1321815 RepID=A0ABN0NYE9_TRELE|nr:hypothetical protein HMPREF9193_01427 [Treponema lecithinolyticum ATCC 700332]
MRRCIPPYKNKSSLTTPFSDVRNGRGGYGCPFSGMQPQRFLSYGSKTNRKRRKVFGLPGTYYGVKA